jgi:3-hydroxyacyl-[acyl-carrier-protein] dehydratase
VFLLEALRQAVAGTFLTLGTAPPDATVVRSLRFLAPLCAGDRAHLRGTLQPLGEQVWFADAQVLRGDGLLAARLKVEFAATVGGPADPDVLAPYELLPHGHPMLLIDRVLALDPGRSITAIKAITCTEPCYRALASALPPASRAYPSALLLESFGQAGALLWFGSHVAPAGVIMLASARNCRIEGQAYPGDVLRHVVSLDKVVDDTVLVAGETWVGERRVAVIESMMAAVRPQAGLGARVAPPTNAPS